MKAIIKTITWRVVGTCDTLLLAYLVTGDWRKGLAISGIELITKMLLYYFHEKAWERILKPNKQSDEQNTGARACDNNTVTQVIPKP